MRQFRISKQITCRESASLDKYLLEIAKIPLLNSEEELILALEIKKGNKLALERLVNANLRFVISVAKQYHNQGLALADLINEGNLGLIKAAHKFDLCKGFKFISYAVWWIRQSILQALADYSRVVKLPQNKIDAISKICKIYNRLEQDYQREPTAEEIAIVVDMCVPIVELSIQSYSFHLSLDADIVEDEESHYSMCDSMISDINTSPDFGLNLDSLKIEIERLLSHLEEREAEVLSSFFGLKDQTAYSLDDISKRFGITRERVRQIKDSGIKKLKNIRYNQMLKSFMGQD